MQLPALEHLNLTVTSEYELVDPSTAAALGKSLPLLGGLTALALQAGSLNGHLRHLRLPPSVKASVSAPFVCVLVSSPVCSGERMPRGACSNGGRVFIWWRHCNSIKTNEAGVYSAPMHMSWPDTCQH